MVDTLIWNSAASGESSSGCCRDRRTGDLYTSTNVEVQTIKWSNRPECSAVCSSVGTSESSGMHSDNIERGFNGWAMSYQ